MIYTNKYKKHTIVRQSEKETEKASQETRFLNFFSVDIRGTSVSRLDLADVVLGAGSRRQEHADADRHSAQSRSGGVQRRLRQDRPACFLLEPLDGRR